jgi:hypothetical protein
MLGDGLVDRLEEFVELEGAVTSTGALATVVTSNRAGSGSRAGLDVCMFLLPFGVRSWSAAVRPAVACLERGDRVGGDLVECLGGIGDHGDAVALD